MATHLRPVADSESPKPRRGRPPGKSHASVIGKNPGVVDMVRLAFRPAHALATVIGLFFGALVPFATFCVAHFERVDAAITIFGIPVPPSVQLAIVTLIVVGGLTYSAWNVCQWMRLAKGSWVQAVGFTILAELIMVGSHQIWLSIVVLVYLCAINAIATGVSLVRGSRLQDASVVESSEG